MTRLNKEAELLIEFEDTLQKIDGYLRAFYQDIMLMGEDFLEDTMKKYMTPVWTHIATICKEVPYDEKPSVKRIMTNAVRTLDEMLIQEQYVCQTMNDFIHFVFVRTCRKFFYEYIMSH